MDGAVRRVLATCLTSALCACVRPQVVASSVEVAATVHALRVPAPTDPKLVSELFSDKRPVRATVRLDACWAHPICVRSAPLWAKSAMLEEFRFTRQDVRSLVGAYFQNDRYYVTANAQIMVAHNAASRAAERWVERTGHHWSLWRESDVRPSDRAEMLFVLQPGWIGTGPRATWLAHEGALRAHKLVLGDGPFVDAHIGKQALSKRLPPEVSDARVTVSLLSDGGGTVEVTMNVTNDAAGVADKMRALLSDENGFMLRVATRDVLAGALVRAAEAQVVVTIPVSVVQAVSMLALAGAYVGADADP